MRRSPCRYPRLHRVNVAVGDCGIGVRASLSSRPEYEYLRDRPHWEAATRAFEESVTRKHEGGTGLTLTMESVLEMGGGLVLATGDGFFRAEPGKDPIYGQMAYDLTGVQVGFWIPERGDFCATPDSR